MEAVIQGDRTCTCQLLPLTLKLLAATLSRQRTILRSQKAYQWAFQQASDAAKRQAQKQEKTSFSERPFHSPKQGSPTEVLHLKAPDPSLGLIADKAGLLSSRQLPQPLPVVLNVFGVCDGLASGLIHLVDSVQCHLCRFVEALSYGCTLGAFQIDLVGREQTSREMS